jgi:MHS family citrate/tricarballylate:H+ symporter-like MFS transporter
MLWLVDAPSFGKMLTVVLIFSSYFGLYNGAMVATLTEIMPPQVRTAGFSLAFSLATAIFGGFTPLVSTALIEMTGNRASPALWLCFAALVSLTAVFLSRHIAEVSEPAAVPS